MRTSYFTFLCDGLFSEKYLELENVLVYNNVWKLLWVTYKFCGNTSEF
jgi:hypothetical protein